MATLKALRRRVASVKNSQKITKAMKLVSAAKLRRAQQAVEATRPFADAIDGIVGRIAARVDASKHPLLARREIKRINLVVVTSDRGLAGAFNSNINRAAEAFVREAKAKGQEVIVTAIGKRARDYCRLKKYAPLAKSYTDISGALSYGTAELIAEFVIPQFLEGAGVVDVDADGVPDSPEKVQEYANRLVEGHSARPEEIRSEHAPAPESTGGIAPAQPAETITPIDAVVVIYTRFRSAISQVVTQQQILPMEPPAKSAEADLGIAIDYKYEPGQREMLDALLPRQVKMQIFRALLESVASEHGARMTAMDNASSNAADFIYRLTLQMNRARQAIITKELMEIVSGKEALEG